MVDLREELLRIVRTLDAAKVPYALCGGLAVVVHGFPRATQDVDLLLLADDVPRAKSALESLGYTLQAGPMTFRAGKPEEQHVHRVSRAAGQDLISIDLLVAGPFLDDVWAGRETYDLNGTPLVVVSRSGLAKMKRSAGRLQDLADIEKLEFCPNDDEP